ncbi:hypothetical protein GN958_ATG07140, partial [Phytophthora infestans]
RRQRHQIQTRFQVSSSLRPSSTPEKRECLYLALGSKSSRHLVEKSVHRTGTATDESHRDTCGEEANFDVDIADYHNTVTLMEEMELVVDSVYDRDEDSCPPTQPFLTTEATTSLNPITSPSSTTLSDAAR